ncbi:MAG: DNA primase [Phytoplasma sp.]|uniref:DNA primase n=1 Tax=Phytoplasma sp. TaxID=2155 RepID=UPI002B40AE1E|nr:DNA primase [Phytoplasma sp.]WRH06753.1 MAG: DNA primase [Phytoplasma sp.]
MNDVGKNLIIRLNQEISIYELVIKMGIILHKRGKNFLGLCPFHREKTPSFSVSPEKNIALCMACHKGGNPVNFYRQLKDISLSEVIQQLAELFNFKLPNKKQYIMNNLDLILETVNKFYQKSLSLLLNKEEYKEHPLTKYLFNERKLNLELIQEFGLGYSHKSKNALIKHLVDKLNYKYEDLLKLGLIFKSHNTENNQIKYFDFFQNRLIFPLTNTEGKIVGFCGRLFSENHEEIKQPKYLFNSQLKKEHLLYRFFEHQRYVQEKKELILCEGFFDVIAFYKIGIKNVIATLGTYLNLVQVISLKKITKKVIIALDSDNAGKEAIEYMALLLNKNKFRVYVLILPSDSDPDEYIVLNQYNITLLKKRLEDKIKDYIFLKIDDLIIQGFDKEQIKLKIIVLLKYHDKETIKYFQNKINEKYQIQINFFSASSPWEINNKLLKQQNDKISLRGIIRSQDKEKSILTELFLTQKYIDFVLEESYKYRAINSNIIELIRMIKEYYIKYGTKEEKVKNGINISNFKKIYKHFLDNLSNSKEIYDLLFKVEENFVFKQRIRIDSQEYLKSLFYPFEIEEYFIRKQETKKEIQIIKELIINEEDVLKVNKLFEELKKYEDKLINIEKNQIKLN